MQTTMTVKGQVTIPKAVRERAGLRPGMRVEVTNDDSGKVVLSLVVSDPSDDVAWQQRYDAMAARIDRLVGTGRTGQSTDAFMATIRDPVPM